MTSQTDPTISPLAVVDGPALVDELLGHLAIFRPSSPPDEGSVEEGSATTTEIILVNGQGAPKILGVRNVRWRLVRQQLTEAFINDRWLAGVLVQTGVVFQIMPPSREDLPLLRRALAGLGSRR
jgi:hypothetical protein